ncbi:MAG: PAS domain S-box protein [Bacteroidetes bacterium]|nr:PAS domain S-box protein [Bacteroidota bacterium]
MEFRVPIAIAGDPLLAEKICSFVHGSFPEDHEVVCAALPEQLPEKYSLLIILCEEESLPATIQRRIITSGSVPVVLVIKQVNDYFISLYRNRFVQELILEKELNELLLEKLVRIYCDEQKKFDERTGVASRLHEAFVNLAMDNSIITTIEGKIIFWGKLASKVYGYTEKEMLDTDISSVFYEDHLHFTWQNAIRNLQAKEQITDEFQGRNKIGKAVWVHVQMKILYDNKGIPAGIAIMIREITNEKLEQLRLKVFESVVKNSKEAILVCEIHQSNGNMKTPIVYVNSAFTDMTGYATEEASGKNPEFLFARDNDAKTLEEIQTAIKKSETIQAEIVQYKKDGTAYWNNLVFVPVSDSEGNYTHLVSVQRDVTERRKYVELLRKHNDELTKVNIELDKFVYGASHDLRAPLNSILGLAALMRREKYGEDAKIYLDKISQSIKRLDDFIANIIRYSRNTRLIPTHETIDFAEIFKVATDLLGFSEKGSRMHFYYHNPDNIILKSDKDRWQVIINNLFSNSIKFSRNIDEAYVKLSLMRVNEKILVSIEDNGTGIAKDRLNSIFEMFYRGDEKASGTGLGLFIVKQTVEAMGCTISVESSINYRTTFTITTSN